MSNNNKKQEPSSPDFNDEFIHYGLGEFTTRIKKRLNDTVNALKEKSTEKQSLAEPQSLDDIDTNNSENRAWQLDFLSSRGEPKGCAQNAFLIFENDGEIPSFSFSVNVWYLFLSGTMSLILSSMVIRSNISSFLNLYFTGESLLLYKH